MALKGIYVFAPAGNAARIAQEVKSGPFQDVAGFDWLVGWDKVAPAASRFDWTVVDAARAAAQSLGKTSQICMLPGFAEPAWLLTLVKTIQIQQYNTGKFVTMANPVDPAFLTEWDSLIAAFASHCAGDSDIASVQTTGCGDQGEMIMGKLVTGVWADYGITPATLGAAWQRVITTWATHWGSHVRALAIEEPLNKNIPVLPNLITWLAVNHPHMALQQNGLTSHTGTGPNSYGADLAAWAHAKRPVGWQMFGSGSQNGNLAQALNIGMSVGATYFQIYAADILNPANTALLTQIAAALAKL